MAKYKIKMHAAYCKAFATDTFYRDVDPDAAIAMIQLEWKESYEEMSNDLDIGLKNG